MKDRDYQLFEDYISNTLNQEEAKTFEKRLTEDSDFREAFALYKETSSFLEHKFKANTEREAFKSNLSKIGNTHSSHKTSTTKVKKFQAWKYAVAASVLVVVGLFFSQWFGTPVYDDYANYPQISLTVRGESNQTKMEAENAFNTQNYQQAIPLFRTLLENNPDNPELQLYLALSLVEQNEFSEADALFNSLTNQATAYQNQARWFAALSKLKQKDIEQTKALLNQIPQEAEEYTRAQKLLKKLK